jgi:Family of unknown function (DUF6496)
MPSSEVMGEYKAGKLRSGSKKGPKVKNRKQAIAIMMSERRKEGKGGGRKRSRQKSR